MSLSPNLKLLYGMDESGALSTRANAGEAGSDLDLAPWNLSTTDGVPAVSDGLAGKAADLVYNPGDPWTAELRGLWGPRAYIDAQPWMPDIASIFDGTVGQGVTMGFRIKGGFTQTAASPYICPVMGWATHNDLDYRRLFLDVRHDSGAAPTGANVIVRVPRSSGTTIFANTATQYGDALPGTVYNYLQPDEWYRCIVRIATAANGTHVHSDLWVYRESTGDLYKMYETVDKDIATYWIDWQATFGDGVDIAFTVGGPKDSASGHFVVDGPVDEVYFYDRVISDDEAARIAVGGISIPWDEPSYRHADHVVYASVAGDLQDFPQARPLPTGGLVCRFPPDVRCQRARFRYEGWRPGRPWCIRDVQGLFDTAGPFNARRAYPFSLKDPNVGLYRTPGELPSGAWEDVRNVEATEVGPRRRRGFSIIRDVDSAYETAANAFYSFRNFADALHVVYKVGTSLYAETGAGAVEIDTAWGLPELPVFLFLDDRAIILSQSKRVSWRGNTDGVDSFGANAPLLLSAAAGVGGSLDGAYYYAATLYDSQTGDETAPIVLVSAVNPSTEKVTLTMRGGGYSGFEDARFDYYRIYRTNDGGSAPNLFYIDSVAVGSGVSVTYDDTGEPDGTLLVGQVQDPDGNLLGYLTMTLPDDFAIGCVHMERAFYSGGDTYPERIYVTEANEPLTFYDAYYLVADGGPIRALVSWQHRLVAYTDTTVELFESDWVRDASGDVNVQRTVTSRSVGALGPHAVINLKGQLKWMDRRGLWENPARPVQIGDPQIQDLIPYVNHGISSKVVAGFNHVRRQAWWSVPQAVLQEDNTRFQTVYVQHLDKPDRWSLYELEASFHGKFDHDLKGLVYGVMDHLGVMKWMETYEGDGAEGDESWTTEDEGTDDYGTSPAGIASISARTVTAYGSPGWTTDALRGMGVVLRDRSSGVLHYYTIRSNTADTFTGERDIHTDLAAGDGYYVGGIRAYVDFAAQQFGSPNQKTIRQVQTQFMALTGDRYL